MKDYKKEYEDIKASEELKNRIDNIFEEDEKENIKVKKFKKGNFKKYGTIVAGLLIGFVAIANMSPVVAEATSGVPVIGDIVRVITFNRFVYDENGMSADISTAKIEGLLDKELEDELNQEFKEYADTLILGFEKDVKQIKEEYGDEEVHMGIESNYMTKTDNENFLAIDLYTLNIVGSSSTVHSFYTVDKESKDLLTLDGLFKKDSNYVEILSDYIREEMIRQIEEEDKVYWLKDYSEVFEDDMFKEIKVDQNFYINNDNHLVICFDKYDIAPGSEGSPEFIIPFDVIKDIVVNEKIK